MYAPFAEADSDRSINRGMTPRNEECYKSAPSTKIDTLIEIIKYHIERPGLPYFDTSKLGNRAKGFNPETDLIESHGDAPQEDPGMPCEKILIYFSWPFMRNFLTTVFGWNGIEITFLDGSLSHTQRTKVISEFNRAEPHLNEQGKRSQVLFISNVATTGINLPRATIVIMMVRDPY